MSCSWEALYTTEISNHASDPTDVGTIWFDDSSAEDKVLAYLCSKQLALDAGHTSFLDVGTGNGHFLLRLREGGDEDTDEDEEGESEDNDTRTGTFLGRMMGTDYSLKSVEFAARLAASKGAEAGKIEFVHTDIMKDDPKEKILTGTNANGWDVVLDKGTFDAISLSSELDTQGRRIGESYKNKIIPLVREGGFFVVTSCNWTEEELVGWFDGDGFTKVGAVEYRSFSFGGKKGQTISTICFRKTTKG